jgi:ankyrin repeat protein
MNLRIFVHFGVAACLLSAPAICAVTSDDWYTAIRTDDLTKLADLAGQPGSINLKDDRGMTPLMYAAVTGSPAAMKLLIDRGADVNARNAFDSTALMWSATDMEKVRMLVEHGADVNAVSKGGRTALLIAAMSDHSASIVKLLISKGANIKAVDKGKMTSLLAAAQGCDPETVRLMVDAGLDVNAADKAGFTPLILAVESGNSSAVKFLIAKGANVNAVTVDRFEQVKNGPLDLGKFTALTEAATENKLDMVRALLDAGADINARDVRGMTPLMLAIGTDHQDPEVISALLLKRPDVDAKSLSGETALDWARKFGDRWIIDALKRAGAIESPAKAALAPPAPAPVELKPAVERGIALLEKTNAGFFVNGGCASCHHQNITDFVVSIARTRGLHVDESAAAERRKIDRAFFGAAGPALLERVDTPGTPDLPLYGLAAMAAAGHAPDRMTDALLSNVVAQQFSDGHWYSSGARPPIQDGDMLRTALGIRAMSVYGPPGRGAEMRERIARAKAWLASAKPVTTSDRNMQLLGLSWAGENSKSLEGRTKAILDEQRADGGWAQRAELESDAYATGQTMFALAQAGGIPGNHAAYQRAVKFLLSKQCADGSWYVASRSPKFQPYFESGFPYGHDQWISSMATGWATAALAFAIEPMKTKVGGE